MTTSELAFEDARAFLASWEAELCNGTCFIARPRPLPSSEPVEIKLEIDGLAATLLHGNVTRNDVDAWGQPGVVVALSDEGKAALALFHRQVAAAVPSLNVSPAPMPPGAFATTAVFHKGGTLVPRRPMADGPVEQLLEPGTLLDNRFQIETHIATGGMGEVYRAMHVYLKRPIALKLLKHGLANDPEMWVRFQREAELVSQLESPHVVRVFDFGKTSAGQPFLAMEFVEGNTLDLLLKQEGHLAPARAVELLGQLCVGLEEAHAMGIVHRDLKPSNVMLGKRRDGTPVAKILDFGIARFADAKKSGESLTQLGMVVGTPAYLSPEQALADVLDARTDIYALGCVAFELLTAHPPFEADTLQGLVAKHLAEAPSSPALHRAELNAFPRLCDAVVKALSKDRAQRFQDVKAFAEALKAAIAPAASAFDDWAEPPAAPAVTEEWPPPPPPTFTSIVEVAEPAARVRRPPSDVHPAAQLPPEKKRLTKAFEALALPLTAAQAQRALDSRAALESATVRTTLLHLEVLGVAAGSTLKGRCLARAITAILDFGGTIDALDEDALVAVFTGDAQTLAGRALLASLEIREAVADERRLTSNEPVLVRGALAGGRAEFPAGDAPYDGDLLRRARALSAKTPAGKLYAESVVAAGCEDVAELRDASGSAELVDPRPVLPAGTPRLVGREAQLGQLEKRLTQVGVGIPLPVLVAGIPGSGKSTLAHELTVKARHLSLVVGIAYGLRSLRSQPFGALAEILCNVCGVPKDHRTTRLRPALEALKLEGPELAAALVLGGVEQPPLPFTPGQAVAALRSVLNAGAAGRKVVLVFDGLEAMDSFSVEAFRTLCAAPGARELTIGFADLAFANENLPNLPRLDLLPLTDSEVRKWIVGLLGNAAAEEGLQQFLIANAGGVPARLVDWLHLLADRGWLRKQAGVFGLPDAPDPLEGDQLAAARARGLGPAAARIFEATCLAGDALSSTLLGAVLPDVPPLAYQRLVNSRMIRALGGRRWMPGSFRFADALEGRGNPVLHRRLAQGLLDEARAANLAPEAAVLADHLIRAGDTARGLPLWRHAAESALARRAPRDLLIALKGWADALGVVLASGAPSGDATRARVDSLARASAIALVIADPTAARSLADEAEQLAKVGLIESSEAPLAMARVLRSEARRARAAEALALAEKRAGNSAVLALCLVEKGETREAEGDLPGAAAAFREALTLADAARDFARWHGEINLRARLEARLGGVLLAQKDFAQAQALFTAALDGWRKAGWAWGESRVLANLGTLKAQSNDFVEASRWFGEAVAAAGRCGDLLFQARALLNLARTEKRVSPGSEKATALKASKVAAGIGWEDGRKQAEAMVTG